MVKLLAILTLCKFITSLWHYSSDLSMLFLVILINVNSISVSVANHLNIVFVICKVLTILTIVIAGFVRIGQGLSFFLIA